MTLHRGSNPGVRARERGEKQNKRIEEEREGGVKTTDQVPRDDSDKDMDIDKDNNIDIDKNNNRAIEKNSAWRNRNDAYDALLEAHSHSPA